MGEEVHLFCLGNRMFLCLKSEATDVLDLQAQENYVTCTVFVIWKVKSFVRLDCMYICTVSPCTMSYPRVTF